MSSMLEQAIIDAAALREAALKSAEHAVIEKYAPEIKAAMATLLENDSPRFSRGQSVRYEGRLATVTVENEDGTIGIQEAEGGKTYLVQESDLEEGGAPTLHEDEQTVEEDIAERTEAPLGAVDLEQEGVEEGEQIMFEFTADDFLEEETALDDMGKEETHASQDAQSETGVEGETGPDDSVLNLEEGDEGETLEELINILNEFEDGETLEEEADITVDMFGDDKLGWATTDKETLKWLKDMQRAKEEAAKDREEKEVLAGEVEALDEAKKAYVKQNDKLQRIIKDLNEKLQSTLLSNAKLLYSNRALNDASLNERQKTKIVEAINKAQSVDEAKNLHDTLRVTVGQTQQRGPKSLNETVQRKSNLSSMLTSKRQDVQPVDNFTERMRRLAGLK